MSLGFSAQHMRRNTEGIPPFLFMLPKQVSFVGCFGTVISGLIYEEKKKKNRFTPKGRASPAAVPSSGKWLGF